MRVVAGTARGIPLMSPGTDLRPTMEVVKNAIFNSLMEVVPDAPILDLFAGSGGLGIEALSRGAASCVFVEENKAAIDAIRKNLAKTKLTGGTIVTADVMTWLAKSAPVAAFHVIIADPPYAKYPGERDFTPELLASEGLRKALVPGGLFVLEHLPGVTLPLEGRWECLRQKRYGATEVALLRALEHAAV
jgi:16S rRNA (guanine966-N2)-methyltransferase